MSTSTTAPATAEEISANLIGFIAARSKSPVTAGQDLFASGVVSSLFAMQLVTYVESTFGVAVAGPELRLDNFRTVDSITALVLRLREASDG